MKTYSLTEETINKVLQYLATKPYAEVAQLINFLSQAKPLTTEPTQAAEVSNGATESVATN